MKKILLASLLVSALSAQAMEEEKGSDETVLGIGQIATLGMSEEAIEKLVEQRFAVSKANDTRLQKRTASNQSSAKIIIKRYKNSLRENIKSDLTDQEKSTPEIEKRVGERIVMMLERNVKLKEKIIKLPHLGYPLLLDKKRSIRFNVLEESKKSAEANLTYQWLPLQIYGEDLSDQVMKAVKDAYDKWDRKSRFVSVLKNQQELKRYNIEAKVKTKNAPEGGTWVNGKKLPCTSLGTKQATVILRGVQ